MAADMSADNNARAKKDREALQGTWRDATTRIVVDGDNLTRYDSNPARKKRSREHLISIRKAGRLTGQAGWVQVRTFTPGLAYMISSRMS